MTFGAYLRNLRESRNLRQADLATDIGVSTVYVCDIERDRRYPPDIQKLRVWVTRMFQKYHSGRNVRLEERNHKV